MTPTHLILAAAALAVTGTAQAATPEPSRTVAATYRPQSKRFCVRAEALQPRERAKIGGNRHPCLSRAAWAELGIWFDAHPTGAGAMS